MIFHNPGIPRGSRARAFSASAENCMRSARAGRRGIGFPRVRAADNTRTRVFGGKCIIHESITGRVFLEPKHKEIEREKLFAGFPILWPRLYCVSPARTRSQQSMHNNSAREPLVYIVCFPHRGCSLYKKKMDALYASRHTWATI